MKSGEVSTLMRSSLWPPPRIPKHHNRTAGPCTFPPSVCEGACDWGCRLWSRPLWEVIWPETLASPGARRDVMQADTSWRPPHPPTPPHTPTPLTARALVESSSLPHSLQLPKYHLTVFWQRVDQRGRWRNNGLQALCQSSNPPPPPSCAISYIRYFLAAWKKDLEISTLGELLNCSWKIWGLSEVFGALTELRAKFGRFFVVKKKGKRSIQFNVLALSIYTVYVHICCIKISCTLARLHFIYSFPLQRGDTKESSTVWGCAILHWCVFLW